MARVCIRLSVAMAICGAVAVMPAGPMAAQTNDKAPFETLADLARKKGALVNGGVYSYLAQDSLTNPTQREWGRATYTEATNSFSRSVLGGISAGTDTGTSPVSFSVAPIVSLTALAEDFGIGQAPGDILTTGSTPPSAAYSMARNLFASYTGPLFRVTRASDSATQDIYAGSDGWVSASSIYSFLGNTGTGYVEIIYDQSGTGNTISQATVANQPYLVIKYLPNGRAIAALATPSGHYLRRRTGTTNIPIGTVPITVYSIICPDLIGNQPDGTIGFFGDMESTVADTGNGHMFATAFGSQGGWTGGVGSGPWIGVDWENGIYASNLHTSVAGAPIQLADFIFILAKTDGSTSFILKGGPAQSPVLQTLWNGGLPTGYTGHFEGGISIGEGGDGSASPVIFIEGMIIPSLTSNNSDNAIQTNLNWPDK